MRKVEDFTKYKAFFLPVIFIIVIFFTGIFFLRPKIFETFELKKKVAGERKTLANLTQKAAFLEGLDEVELMEKTEVLLKALPPEPNIANILITLKVLGLESGITIQGIQVDSKATISLKIYWPPHYWLFSLKTSPN